MKHHELISRLAQAAESRIVLLVLDGVGDVCTASQPRTPLQAANTPHLDALAQRSSLGRLVPVSPGVTPGSGPGHLALFGYDSLSPEADIGRGVLEALGMGAELRRGDVAVRGNFATADSAGELTDRRAGRISTAECRRLCDKIQDELPAIEGLDVRIRPGEGHRFVLLLLGDGLSPHLADTDPQRLGVPPLEPRATVPAAEDTAVLVRGIVEAMERSLCREPKANRVLLRGFSSLPALPSLGDLYRLRCGAFAGYPLYRGVAAACGMTVEPCGKDLAAILQRVEERWREYDYFFLHVKYADPAGEDGDFARKVAVLEEVDAFVPRLERLQADVVAITGDHSTPVPMKAHSWHPVPLLINAATAFVDDTERFDEVEARRGHLGTIAAPHLMGLLLAHADRLAKYGA